MLQRFCNGAVERCRALLCKLATIGLVKKQNKTTTYINRLGYPNKSVRLIVPFAAGGGTDVIARLVAQKVSEAWGWSIVVDNRIGGGSTIGTTATASSAGDGYTLLLTSMGLACNPALYRNLPYDTEKDLIPVVLVASQQSILVVHPGVAAKSVKDLIALVKSKPGEIRYASAGVGAADHLATALFRAMANIDLVHVPYKSGSQSVTATVAGEVHLTVTPMAAALPFARSGKLRALAVTGASRSKVAPELPTIAEAGLPGYEFDGWYALLAPTGTPSPLIRKINDDFNRALTEHDVRNRFAELGIEPLGGTQDKFAAYLKTEIVKWTKAIRDANICLD